MQLAPRCIWHIHPNDFTGKDEILLQLPIDIARGIGLHKETIYSKIDNERCIITDAVN